jgi:hypothetical protein
MKALEDKLIQAPHKKTLGIAGKEAEVIVLRTTESEDGFEMFVKNCQWLRRFIQKIRPISIKDV